MSKFKVVVTDYVFNNLDPEKEIFKEIGAELVSGQCKTLEEVLALVPGAHGMLNTYYDPIDGQVMDAMPDCKIIVRYGIGYNTINVPDATARGIMVANVPDYCIDEVSDHALAMMLSLLRMLPQADKGIRSGSFSLAPYNSMKRISCLTVGVLGFGRIGRAIAAKAAAFGPKVIFFDPYFKGDAGGAESVSLETLLAESDAIIVQAPANAETHHILNAAAFAAMKKSPVIVNCARGELIENEALIAALKSGQVSGAGLDVVENTPPIENFGELLDFDNVILTPHSAWLSKDSLLSLQRMAAMEVVRVLQGGKPNSLLNPEVLGK